MKQIKVHDEFLAKHDFKHVSGWDSVVNFPIRRREPGDPELNEIPNGMQDRFNFIYPRVFSDGTAIGPDL